MNIFSFCLALLFTFSAQAASLVDQIPEGPLTLGQLKVMAGQVNDALQSNEPAKKFAEATAKKNADVAMVIAAKEKAQRESLQKKDACKADRACVARVHEELRTAIEAHHQQLAIINAAFKAATNEFNETESALKRDALNTLTLSLEGYLASLVENELQAFQGVTLETPISLARADGGEKGAKVLDRFLRGYFQFSPYLDASPKGLPATLGSFYFRNSKHQAQIGFGLILKPFCHEAALDDTKTCKPDTFPGIDESLKYLIPSILALKEGEGLVLGVDAKAIASKLLKTNWINTPRDNVYTASSNEVSLFWGRRMPTKGQILGQLLVLYFDPVSLE